MTVYGKISRWDADRGFGLARPDGGGRSVFIHIRALESSGLGVGMLPVGTAVKIETELDRDGRPRASFVEII